MPPKKINLKTLKEKEIIIQTENSKIIKVNKINDKSHKNKISIIKSKDKNKELIIEDIKENVKNQKDSKKEKQDIIEEKEENIIEEKQDTDKEKEENIIEEKQDTVEEKQDTEAEKEEEDSVEEKQDTEEEKEEEKEEEDSVEETEDTEKYNKVQKGENKNNKLISKIKHVIKKDKKTLEKEENQKNHNHSKPKTISISTKVDNNKVDMFEEDDLDFRYVMMNYDFTKNKSEPKITKYEKALLIGKRAKQIEEGANPNVKYQQGQSVISIAEEELKQRKIPFFIRRTIGNRIEYWKPVDMEVNMN